MAGLNPTVHDQVEKYLEANFSPNQRLFKTYDTVEALRDFQIRTVIISGLRYIGENYYSCVQSKVDYTKYIHGDSDYETWFCSFQLPMDAIKDVMMDYLCNTESELKDLRERVAPIEQDFELGSEYDDQETETETEDETLDEGSLSATKAD